MWEWGGGEGEALFARRTSPQCNNSCKPHAVFFFFFSLSLLYYIFWDPVGRKYFGGESPEVGIDDLRG